MLSYKQQTRSFTSMFSEFSFLKDDKEAGAKLVSQAILI